MHLVCTQKIANLDSLPVRMHTFSIPRTYAWRDPPPQII